MVQLQTWQARRFKIYESACHNRIKSNRDVQFEFESNLEALQVPRLRITFLLPHRSGYLLAFLMQSPATMRNLGQMTQC